MTYPCLSVNARLCTGVASCVRRRSQASNPPGICAEIFPACVVLGLPTFRWSAKLDADLPSVAEYDLEAQSLKGVLARSALPATPRGVYFVVMTFSVVCVVDGLDHAVPVGLRRRDAQV